MTEAQSATRDAFAVMAASSAHAPESSAVPAYRAGALLAGRLASGKALPKSQVRAALAGAAGVAALLLWSQIAAAPFIYPQVQSLYYPSSLFLAASCVFVALMRMRVDWLDARFAAAAAALMAVSAAVHMSIGTSGAMSGVCLFAECLGLSVLSCAWIDVSSQRGGDAGVVSLIAGALAAVACYYALQVTGAMDALPWEPGGVMPADGDAVAVSVIQKVVIISLVLGLPAVSAVFLVAVGRMGVDCAAVPVHVSEGVAGPESSEPRFPWHYFAVLVGSGLVCAVFIGMNTNPFIINSRLLGDQVLIASIVACLVLSVLGFARARVSATVLFAVAVVFLCAGLAMYGMGLGGDIVRSLLFVCVANFLLHLLMPLMFVLYGRALPASSAGPLFLIASSVCLSAVGEQLGLWVVSSWSMGIAQIADFGLIAMLLVVVATVWVVVAEARRARVDADRASDRAAESTLAAEAATAAANERARQIVEEARMRAEEKARVADLASKTAEEAALRVEEALRVAQEARLAEEKARRAEEEARRAAEEARRAEEEARARAHQAESGTRVVEVTFETSPEEDLRLVEFFKDRGLSAREIDVMKLVAKRYPNSAIAEKLFITERTVKFHISNSYSKLGVHSRSELVLAIEQHMSAER